TPTTRSCWWPRRCAAAPRTRRRSASSSPSSRTSRSPPARSASTRRARTPTSRWSTSSRRRRTCPGKGWAGSKRRIVVPAKAGTHGKAANSRSREGGNPVTDLLALVVQQSVNGIYLGCLYVMVALGLTLIYGVLNQINFAHADFVTVGAFTAFFTATRFAAKWLGIPDTAAYLLSLITALGVGA